MPDYGWDIGGDYDAWMTTAPPEGDVLACSFCEQEFWGEYDPDEEFQLCPDCKAAEG